MNKKVFVVFSGNPLGSNRFSEKMRMALGLTLVDENQVNCLFLGGARNALGPLKEAAIGMQPVSKHAAMMARLGVKFFSEEGQNPLLPGINAATLRPGEAAGLLSGADVIIH